jgi:F-type H+-transporting ATPase subunit b
MLDINSTLFIQIGNFLLLLLLLNFLLFRPIRRILVQRREEVTSLENMISDFDNRAEQKEKGIEEGMANARKDGFQEKESLRGQGQAEEQEVLQKASSSAEDKIGKAREELESKIADVRKVLEDQTASFSRELAEKILGRSIQ